MAQSQTRKPDIGAEAIVKGEMRLIRIDRATGKVIKTVKRRNQFTTLGLQEIAKRIVAAGTVWDDANLFLDIQVSSGSGAVVGSGTTNILVDSEVDAMGRLVMSWRDNRKTGYTLSGLAPRISSSGAALANYTTFPAGDDWAGGVKPDGEDWIIEWLVSVTGVANAAYTWDTNHTRSFSRRLDGTLTADIEVTATSESSMEVGFVPMFPTIPAGTISDTTEGHTADASLAANQAAGVVATIRRTRAGTASTYTNTGERLRFNSANPIVIVYQGETDAAVQQAIDYTHTFTLTNAL